MNKFALLGFSPNSGQPYLNYMGRQSVCRIYPTIYEAKRYAFNHGWSLVGDPHDEFNYQLDVLHLVYKEFSSNRQRNKFSKSLFNFKQRNIFQDLWYAIEKWYYRCMWEPW